jgi:hypothetical protein
MCCFTGRAYLESFNAFVYLDHFHNGAYMQVDSYLSKSKFYYFFAYR